MSDIKDKATDNIGAAAKATKTGAAKASDESKDLAHRAAHQMQEGAKKLKNA